MASYTGCYRKQGKEIQTKGALTGCVVGTAVSTIAWVVVFVAASDAAAYSY